MENEVTHYNKYANQTGANLKARDDNLVDYDPSLPRPLKEFESIQHVQNYANLADTHSKLNLPKYKDTETFRPAVPAKAEQTNKMTRNGMTA